MSQKNTEFPIVSIGPDIIIVTTNISQQTSVRDASGDDFHPNRFKLSQDFSYETVQDDSENSEMDYIHIPVYFRQQK